jgi:DNA/RNA endonuclease YhcR with UshA esterase domain
LSEVTDELMGKVVTVNGTIESVNIFDSVVVAQFEDSELKLFGFKSNMPVLKIDDFVTVTGEIKEYKGELEIIPSKIGDVLVVSGEN